MVNLTQNDKKIKQLSGELGEALKANDFKGAWSLAGDLNNRLKGDFETSLTEDEVKAMREMLRSYYYFNTQYNNVAKKMFGLGSKFLENAL